MMKNLMTLNAPNQSSAVSCLNHSPFPILEHPSMHLAAQRVDAAEVPLFLHHKLLQRCPLLLLLCNAQVVLASFRPTFSRCLFTPHQASSSLKEETGNLHMLHTHCLLSEGRLESHWRDSEEEEQEVLFSLSLLACARGVSVRAPAPVRRRPSTFFGSFAPSIPSPLLRLIPKHPFEERARKKDGDGWMVGRKANALLTDIT